MIQKAQYEKKRKAQKEKKGRWTKRKKGQIKVAVLEAIQHDVAGIDLGSREHWVCGPRRSDGEPNVERFGTTTSELVGMADWLKEQGVRSVAMESTSVYWIPIYEILESRGFEVLLVNARQLHKVPGRKTDMADCQWIQLLHSCGLLRGSFRPEDAFCRLRTLRRQLANYVEERTRCIQWMQKALDQMNIKVHHAVTDITGKTGMSIIRAIVDGERDPKLLAELRDKRCKKSKAQIAEHLTGNWRDEHLFNLAHALESYDFIQGTIEKYEAKLLAEIKALEKSHLVEEPCPEHPNPSKEKAIRRRNEQELRTHLYRLIGHDLTRIDGISTGVALIVVTEVGTNLSAFPTESDFVSWLRLAPGGGFSAGKRVKKGRAMGATRISNALQMAAKSLKHSKTALGASYRRLSRRKDGGIAVFATARKLAQIIYRMLKYGQDYVDEGERAYDSRFKSRQLSGIKQSAKQLGYKLVPIEEDAA